MGPVLDTFGQGILEYAIVVDDFFSPSFPIADVLFHRVAKSYFRTKERMIRTTTKGWYYRDVKWTPQPVSEYVTISVRVAPLGDSHFHRR
ncbi:hypothetical protein RB195_007200 [Necator americanus]|uniref:Uncharacterized protein n=1 Tax=Necator americanus TaxID=51031 RepID=A0ABR1BW36_NECAM